MSHPSAAAEPSEIAGRYQIIKKLGAGAFGTVYKAKDRILGRMVAIKTIRLEGLAAAGAGLTELMDRFKREAQVSAMLKHPNIVTIYDIGESDGVSYIAMEFIDGVGLERVISSEGRVPLERACILGAQVADALDFAHRGNVVHRDIKPANIMVEAGDRVKVTDFGIAKVTDSGDHLTMTGSLLGTPSYMSPEQARGGALDGRSDLFAVGAILYEMLVGKKAFRGESITGLIFKIITEEPPSLREQDLEVPDEMVRIIARALAKTPEARYQTGKELADDLLALTRAGTTPTVRQAEVATASGLPAGSSATVITPGTVHGAVPTMMTAGPTVVTAGPTVITPRPPAGSPPPPVPGAPPPVPVPGGASARATRAPGAQPSPIPPPAARSGSGAGLMIGLVVGGMFLALAAAGGAWWMFGRKTDPTVATSGSVGAGGAATGTEAERTAGTSVEPSVAPPSPTAATPADPAVPATSGAGSTTVADAGSSSGTAGPPPAGGTTTGAGTAGPAAGSSTAGRARPAAPNADAAPVAPRLPAAEPAASAPADFAFLDQAPAAPDGREAGGRLSDGYTSRQGRQSSGSFGASGPLRARPRIPRDLTRTEFPAVNVLLHVMRFEGGMQRKAGRYGSLADLQRSAGLRLPAPVSGNAFQYRGYRFELTVEEGGFKITALPLSPGGRAFVGDDGGFITEID